MPISQNTQWGEMTQKEPTKEEELEMKRIRFCMQAGERLKDPRLNPMERKQLTNQIKLARKHKFWDTQPVKKFLSDRVQKDGPIQHGKVEDVAKVPAELPAGFEWVTIDMDKEEDANQVFQLLRNHYVEDSEGIFRFDYPVDFLKWTLCVPGFNKDWHIGVKAAGKDSLLGFISGTPQKVVVNSETVKMAEINFLCVHKKLRSKKLAPILIKEVTRRVNLTNVWSAIYTSGDMIPSPFTFAPYFHRSLNPKKNVETGFSAIPSNEPMARYNKRLKLHGLQDMNLVGNPRLMESKDIPAVCQLYKNHMSKYNAHFKLNQNEIAHHLMPRPGVVYTLVFEGEDDQGKKAITDFISFYSLPSQILKRQNHDHTQMNIAYLYYYAFTKNSLTEMMKYVLHFAKEEADVKYDVFNCLSIMDNHEFVRDLKFGVGDGTLNYYMFNYGLKDDYLRPNMVATVLV
uniref:Glycylpeptide N-tetradecanoyltransferase n=1 Tax=Strombidium inclinatum TaxID=197538 RepID=A0A7S3IWN5_9SPIT|mmetsp:Transcript_40619/g.61889  ORF Transcript_40619/g.61889 Transcript_40619/m.61889 type:complete len:457 (+) Transcript_40619:47-1417(+)